LDLNKFFLDSCFRRNDEAQNMPKALVLLSGGLDSLLAAKVLMEQSIEVTGVSFKSYFFDTAKAVKAAEQLGIKLIEVDFSEEHLAMVKNPKHGYGKNMNPCIDCHALMLKKAREMLDHPPSLPTRGNEHLYQGGKYDFVATGEVLGERPMSQNAQALQTVEKESGLTGRLIRPLSAKLLKESDAEKAGLVIRRKLLAISGRSRKPQLALVEKYGIKEYSSPDGGCLLTDSAFSEKLMKLLEYWPDSLGVDIALLRNGRIFWLKNKTGRNILLAVGRDKKNNEALEALARPGDVLIKFAEAAGPTSLVRITNYPHPGTSELRITKEMQEIEVPRELKMGELRLGESKSDAEILETALILTGYYAVKARGKQVKLAVHPVK
jgi:tRNA-uridine 2-sulfurtransferase